MGKKQIKRPVVELETSGQLALDRKWRQEEWQEGREEKGTPQPAEFKRACPERILVGNDTLRDYLQKADQTAVFGIREFLASLDWEEFEKSYKGGGRPPYHPAVMVGLVLFGLMEGKSSLRQLEQLGKTDVRAWWITGGMMPDHSVIGRFVHAHGDHLSEGFFEELTRGVLKASKSSTQSLAGDGTVVQAAASRYRRIKREAAEEWAAQAGARAQAEPENEKLARQAAEAEQVAQAAREREAARRAQRKSTQHTKVSPSEAEAVIQPLKNKSTAPAYKPSILANQDRIIVAQSVHPSSETALVKALLEQAKEVNGPVRQVLLDAGYFSGGVIETVLEEGVEDLLCPAGSEGSEEGQKGFHKSRFRYDEKKDCYWCPAGQRLVRLGESQDGKRYVRYGRGPCSSCSLRSECTRSPEGRTIKRYEDEELKEALREVMAQPGAQAAYARRKAWVEPVFSSLKEIQGLTRFRRRGLRNVRLEFALHAMAHNVNRLLRLLEAAKTPSSPLERAWIAQIRHELSIWGSFLHFCRAMDEFEQESTFQNQYAMVA